MDCRVFSSHKITPSQLFHVIIFFHSAHLFTLSLLLCVWEKIKIWIMLLHSCMHHPFFLRMKITEKNLHISITSCIITYITSLSSRITCFSFLWVKGRRWIIHLNTRRIIIFAITLLLVDCNALAVQDYHYLRIWNSCFYAFNSSCIYDTKQMLHFFSPKK